MHFVFFSFATPGKSSDQAALENTSLHSILSQLSLDLHIIGDPAYTHLGFKTSSYQRFFSVGSKDFCLLYGDFLVTILHFLVNIVNFKNLRSKNIYFISNHSFLIILEFNIKDIEIIVYYASFQMLHTEVGFL